MQTAVTDELEAIKEIFCSVEDKLEIVKFEANPETKPAFIFAVRLSCNGFRISLAANEEYPRLEPPSLSLSFESLTKDTEFIQFVTEELKKIIQDNFTPNEPCLYQIIDECRQYLTEVKQINVDIKKQDEERVEIISNGVMDEINFDEQNNEWRTKIIHGDKIIVKKSIFQAHICCIDSEQEARYIYISFKNDKRYSKATHNIMAYRVSEKVSDRMILKKDNDDDGENAAGSKLMHLLELMNCKNILVIVSRWYGGILLGPQRFKIINNCARTLIQQQKKNQN